MTYLVSLEPTAVDVLIAIITYHKPQTASIMPRHSGSIVDALLLGYVVAAGTLYRSCHTKRNYCEELLHSADIKTTGTFDKNVKNIEH